MDHKAKRRKFTAYASASRTMDSKMQVYTDFFLSWSKMSSLYLNLYLKTKHLSISKYSQNRNSKGVFLQRQRPAGKDEKTLWLKRWELRGTELPCVDQGITAPPATWGACLQCLGNLKPKEIRCFVLWTNCQAGNKVWSHRSPLTWQGDCVPTHTQTSCCHPSSLIMQLSPKMLRQCIWTSDFGPSVLWKHSAALTGLWNWSLLLGNALLKDAVFFFHITDLWVPLKINCKRNYHSGLIFFVWKSSRVLSPAKRFIHF